MTSTGNAIAQALEGCWRLEPPPLKLSPARMAQLAPLLAESGAGALLWRRGRRSAAREYAGAELLHQSFARQALDAQLQERKIEEMVQRLQAHGIEPLLIKGCGTARLYPEPGLRPPGDIDLLVRPEQAEQTSALLGAPIDAEVGYDLDIKAKLIPLYGLSVEGVMRGSRRLPLRQAWVHIPGEEDELRLLCLHFLRHGAWRPLWLCDISAALEARSEGFSWNRCLGSEPVRADYVACALGLAHQLLGARVAGTPVEERARNLPPWLVPAVLQAWATPMISQHAGRPLLAKVPRRPTPLMHALLDRWPGPIEASIAMRMPLGVSPFPAQALFYAGVCLGFLQKSLRTSRGASQS